MTREAIPSVRRPFTSDDTDVEILSTPYSSVRRHRGLGDSGRRVQIVEFDCPRIGCNYDRALRNWHVNPDCRDYVEYYCMHPGCPHYHRGQFPMRTAVNGGEPVHVYVECSNDDCREMFDLTDYPEQEGTSPICPDCIRNTSSI